MNLYNKVYVYCANSFILKLYSSTRIVLFFVLLIQGPTKQNKTNKMNYHQYKGHRNCHIIKKGFI